MNKKNVLLFSLGLIALGVLGRLAPHLWNATPLGAIALFAASYFGLRMSLPVTLSILFITDLAIGFYDWRIMASVYASFALAAILGRLTSRSRAPYKVGLAVLGSSTLFFLATNLAVWQFGTMYPHTLSGLADSYIAALPFFRNSIIGDSMYALALFGSYELYLSLRPSAAKGAVAA
ncbi:MAG: hypothetical protein HZA81_01240 [Candidatus Taylorbacteria bacterium]|nr:hypothetical protein [Candidatus Taylorbacteria bacterium]